MQINTLLRSKSQLSNPMDTLQKQESIYTIALSNFDCLKMKTIPGLQVASY